MVGVVLDSQHRKLLTNRGIEVTGNVHLAVPARARRRPNRPVPLPRLDRLGRSSDRRRRWRNLAANLSQLTQTCC